jgi:hypothetical protein
MPATIDSLAYSTAAQGEDDANRRCQHRARVPPGHYPPPGKCRLGYPERPPGHQPPPGNCYPVPRGAWVVRHPQKHPGRVQITVYEPRRPGKVISIGEFESNSGALLRVLLEN